MGVRLSEKTEEEGRVTGWGMYELGFFCSFSYWAGRGGAGTRPFLKIESVDPPDTTGFEEFQPEPAKQDTKTARVGAVRCGARRVGRIGQVLPTPNKG